MLGKTFCKWKFKMQTYHDNEENDRMEMLLLVYNVYEYKAVL